jgi:hypothetical protein
MTAEQEASYNMFRDTHQVRTDNDAFVLTIPQMDSLFNDLKLRIANISGLASLQSQVIVGISIDKEKLKQKMATLQFNYAGPGRAWAAGNNDDTTYEALNIKVTTVMRTRDDLAGPLVLNIYNLLNANAAALLPFGLTPAMLNELNTTISDYTAIVPLPANAINIRQTYTTNIENKIKDTSLFLERQLDNIVRGQFIANPDFVSTYFNSREIIDPPTNSTTFKVTVLEDGTNNPIFQAAIEAVGKAKFTQTDIDGKGELKQFKKDTYTILVSKAGYNPSQQIVPIGLGETKELTFKLVKLP